MNNDDEKEDNKPKGQQVKISDPQALNDIKAISAQITATSNPAELSRLASAARNIKTNDPYIQDIINKVESHALTKLEIAENQVSSNVTAEQLAELERQREREEEIIKYKIATAQQIQELNTLRSDFKKSAEDYKKLVRPMEDMVKKNSKGEEIIDEKAIDKNILSQKEIEEGKQKYLELTEKENRLNVLIEKANTEKKALEEENKTLSEQLKDKNLSSEERKELENKLAISNEKLVSKNILVKEANEAKKDIQEEIESIKVLHKENREKIDNLGNAIEKTKDTRDPNKHQQLLQKHSLLSNQHEAIVNNKKIDDQALRQNTLDKIKTQDKTNKIKGSLSNLMTKHKNNQAKQGEGEQKIQNNAKSHSSKINTKKTGWIR